MTGGSSSQEGEPAGVGGEEAPSNLTLSLTQLTRQLGDSSAVFGSPRSEATLLVSLGTGKKVGFPVPRPSHVGLPAGPLRPLPQARVESPTLGWTIIPKN